MSKISTEMQCNAAPIDKKQCIEISCLNNFSIYVIYIIYVIFDHNSFEVLNLNLKLRTSNLRMCVILNESLPESKSDRYFNQSQNSSKFQMLCCFVRSKFGSICLHTWHGSLVVWTLDILIGQSAAAWPIKMTSGHSTTTETLNRCFRLKNWHKFFA